MIGCGAVRRDFGGETVTELPPRIDVPVMKNHRHAESASFPGRLENHFAVLAWRLNSTVQIQVNTCGVGHLARSPTGNQPTDAGAWILVTPTRESRVTNATSSSSVIPSVPAGRSGRT